MVVNSDEYHVCGYDPFFFIILFDLIPCFGYLARLAHSVRPFFPRLSFSFSFRPFFRPFVRWLIRSRRIAQAINTIEAADAGKHVFIEKPMALTEKEAADIEAARVRNNVSRSRFTLTLLSLRYVRD